MKNKTAIEILQDIKKCSNIFCMPCKKCKTLDTLEQLIIEQGVIIDAVKDYISEREQLKYLQPYNKQSLVGHKYSELKSLLNQEIQD